MPKARKTIPTVKRGQCPVCERGNLTRRAEVLADKVKKYFREVAEEECPACGYFRYFRVEDDATIVISHHAEVARTLTPVRGRNGRLNDWPPKPRMVRGGEKPETRFRRFLDQTAKDLGYKGLTGARAALISLGIIKPVGGA